MIDLYNSTNSKALHVYHGFAPTKIMHGKGALLYDYKQREFLDCGMALGSVSLGYAYEQVDEFVINCIRRGVNFSRPSYLEEQLTCSLRQDLGNPSLVARYAKSSSMLLSVIPRVARYLTNKRYISYPKNSFLGNTDWYLSHSTNGGILSEIKETTLTFTEGDSDSIQSLFDTYGDKLACIVMEPYRDHVLNEEFYTLLADLCKKNNVLLIFDETVTGYRFYYPLAQSKINCVPDLTIIGKAIANGYAIAAVVGNQSIMQAIEEASMSMKLFDFSTTHAGESIGLAAALETLCIYKAEKVVEALENKGKRLMALINESINHLSLEEFFRIKGQPSYFKLTCASQKAIKNMCGFFYQHGILCRGTFAVSLSHSYFQIEKIGNIFLEYCKTLNSNDFG